MKAQIAPTLAMEYDACGVGQPLVLLHAFPLSRAMWRRQLEALADIGQIIAPDQRGFGGTSPFAGPPSVEQMADDVAALLDALNIHEPVIVAGLSMGGYVALAFARRHADRLRALILADTRSEPDNAEGKANRDKMITFAQSHSARDVIDQMLPKMLAAETLAKRPEVVEEVRRIASAQTPDGIIGGLKALRDRPDSSGILPAIKAPTLVLVGSEDAITPPTMAEKLAAGIPGAKLERIPGAGHLSNLEQPEAFNGAVRAFLKALSAVGGGA